MNRYLANTILGIISLAISFALAELACRVFLEPPQRVISDVTPKSAEIAENKTEFVVEKRIPGNNAKAEDGDDMVFFLDTGAGRRNSPNRRIIIKNHRFNKKTTVIETNSLGYRSPEIGTKIGKRILFLGDSITFAGYLDEKDTFVRQVETKARSKNKNWETINTGVGGIGLKSEMAILLETGLSVDPDVVVLNFYLNDFLDSPGIHVLKLPFWLEHSWLAYHLVKSYQLITAGQLIHTIDPLDRDRLNLWKTKFKKEKDFSKGRFNQNIQTFNQNTLRYFVDYGGAWSEDAWDYMFPLFLELKRLSKAHNFELMFVIHPIYHQVYSKFKTDFPQQKLKEIAASLDVPFLDLLPALRQQAVNLDGEKIYSGRTNYKTLFYDQCHHTPAGSDVVAEELYNFLSVNIK